MAQKIDDLYETLCVPRDCDAKQIKKAYNTLALRYHPDRNRGDDEAKERFQEVLRAYEVLKDPVQRKDYDVATYVATMPANAPTQCAPMDYSTGNPYAFDFTTPPTSDPANEQEQRLLVMSGIAPMMTVSLHWGQAHRKMHVCNIERRTGKVLSRGDTKVEGGALCGPRAPSQFYWVKRHHSHALFDWMTDGFEVDGYLRLYEDGTLDAGEVIGESPPKRCRKAEGYWTMGDATTMKGPFKPQHPYSGYGDVHNRSGKKRKRRLAHRKASKGINFGTRPMGFGADPRGGFKGVPPPSASRFYRCSRCRWQWPTHMYPNGAGGTKRVCQSCVNDEMMNGPAGYVSSSGSRQPPPAAAPTFAHARNNSARQMNPENRQSAFQGDQATRMWSGPDFSSIPQGGFGQQSKSQQAGPQITLFPGGAGVSLFPPGPKIAVSTFAPPPMAMQPPVHMRVHEPEPDIPDPVYSVSNELEAMGISLNPDAPGAPVKSWLGPNRTSQAQERHSTAGFGVLKWDVQAYYADGQKVRWWSPEKQIWKKSKKSKATFDAYPEATQQQLRDETGSPGLQYTEADRHSTSGLGTLKWAQFNLGAGVPVKYANHKEEQIYHWDNKKQSWEKAPPSWTKGQFDELPTATQTQLRDCTGQPGLELAATNVKAAPTKDPDNYCMPNWVQQYESMSKAELSKIAKEEGVKGNYAYFSKNTLKEKIIEIKMSEVGCGT